MAGDATTQPSAGGSVISLPKGGGAIAGLGESFSPDLATGTGRFSVPIPVPAGRRGLQPELALVHSASNGNSPWGLGWQLSLPGVSRKDSRRVPRYLDSGIDADVFVLAGFEDLVPVAGSYPGRVRYRPRTEGSFARIEHVHDGTGNFWEVRTRDGILTRYGTPRPASAGPDWRDPATVADPGDPGRIAAWRITETRDPLDSLIRYEYTPDAGEEPGHAWHQPLPARISYVDYGDPDAPSFLVRVEFEYDPRPDAFTTYRSGFEVRTTLRCRTVRVVTHAADGVRRTVSEHRLAYEQAPFNDVSLLNRVELVGIDGAAEEPMPPLTFEYTAFDPAGRRFTPVTGPGLPVRALSDPSLDLVDLHGAGLPDLVELGGPGPSGHAQRYWRNLGGGRFALPRLLTEAPPVPLSPDGVRFMDADGDGRADLVALGAGPAGSAGYFPMAFGGGWSRRSFRPYRQVPGTGREDPRVKLVDLDGDGVTDLLRVGERIEAFFNDPDPRRSWLRRTVGPLPADGPELDFADPRIRLADMTGDGLSDLVLLRNGNVAYWPNLGHGRWGARIIMRRSPRLPDGFDPARVLLGDVDGDGTADLIYVDSGRVLVWGNRSGGGWTEQPLVIPGLPDLVDTDAVQLADLHGTGMAGLLFSRDADGSGRPHLRFLDLTGGVKPYLLAATDNHRGARLLVEYRSSTQEYLRDQADPAYRWRTTLPFPVQVVSRTVAVDEFSHGRLASEYRYHHGYWDGVEREFRGFGLVEQLDTLDAEPPDISSPPTLTRSWFHLGPVAAVEAGDWTELDLSDGYAGTDPPALPRPPELVALLSRLNRNDRRAALRAMRGRLLRTELYALDGSPRQDRPYTVTERLTGLREESPPAPGGPPRARVFFPFDLGELVTQRERGDDPMRRFTFPAGYDAYGQSTGQLAVGVPRGAGPRASYLATYETIEYAQRDDPGRYLVDRIARRTGFEVVNDGDRTVEQLRAAVVDGVEPAGVTLRLIEHARTHYDGDAFVGLPVGRLGEHGLPSRVESLAMPDGFLDEVYPPGDPRPPYLDPVEPNWSAEYPEEFRALVPKLGGYAHYRDADVPGSPGGFYVVTARECYDVQEPVAGRAPRGLTIATRDPLGATSRMAYDAHDLLLVRTVDAVGLTAEARYDHRVLKPLEVTNANGNTTRVTYSPLGLVTAQFLRGKDGEGDRDAPSVRMVYDHLAFVERRQPVSVHSIRRIYHDTDDEAPAEGRDDTISTVEFADGFGRVLQVRGQAEDPPNVIVSGWQLYDNKGRVVRLFEPFFATGFDYAEPTPAQLGRSTSIDYDPRGQAVRTVSPDGSELRVVFGVPVDLADPDSYLPTPWESYTYDANDNAGRTHPEAAEGYRSHWNTPTSAEVDALGRTVRLVTRTGPGPDDALTTGSAYDIQGHLVSITDPLGRVAFQSTVDLGGRSWRKRSIDAGERLTVPDPMGTPIESRDGRGALTLGAFDRLHRPVRLWARDRTGDPVTLRQRVEYGDAGDPDQPARDRAAARARNLLGRPVRHHDEAGLVTAEAVDFRGNVLESVRQVVDDRPVLATYQRGAANSWRVAPFRVDWTPARGQGIDELTTLLVEPTGYRTSATFDAMNRTVRRILPSDVEGRRHELRPAFDAAGALERVLVDGEEFVRRIARDAKGNRTLIVFANGVSTRYAYDPDTTRLARLLTERPGGEVLQDSAYGYDLAGNVLAILDRTPGGGVKGNPAALGATDARLRALLGSGDALERRFTYDPLYRLLAATGRESQAPPAGDPFPGQPRGTDPGMTQPYEEHYKYDAAGNLLAIQHTADGGFTRAFTVEPDSNRLRAMHIGKVAYEYAFDANGNVVGETRSRHFTWNHEGRLTTFATQTPGAEPSVHAHYLYGASGERVKKLVRRQGGAVEVTHYIDGTFEHHRWSGAKASENNHLHVLDDEQRIAVMRFGPAHPDDRGPAVAIHLADHLSSSVAVLDASGALMNREEYTPYGETSFGSYTRKRYRFTGKERDEESGLNYHSDRYLMTWTGRWTACDPDGPDAGLNLYAYARTNPLRWVDPSGRSIEDDVLAFDRHVGDFARRVDEAVEDFGTLRGQLDKDGVSASEMRGRVNGMARRFRDLHAEARALRVDRQSLAGQINRGASIGPARGPFGTLTLGEMLDRNTPALNRAEAFAEAGDRILEPWRDAPAAGVRGGAGSGRGGGGSGPVMRTGGRLVRGAVGVAGTVARVLTAFSVIKHSFLAGTYLREGKFHKAFMEGVYLLEALSPVPSGRPTKFSTPVLGEDQSIFATRIDSSQRSGCQICHDAVRVDNYFKGTGEGRVIQETIGSMSRNGIPTDTAVRIFEQNRFPLNPR